MTFKNMDDVRAANARIRQKWFNPSSVKWFNSVVETELIDGEFFITSERMYTDMEKTFTIRKVLPNGEIADLSKFQEFKTLEAAKDALINQRGKLKLRCAIHDAYYTGNASWAGQIADKLRFKLGMNYNQMMEIVDEAGISKSGWDALLYEADRQDSLGR